MKRRYSIEEIEPLHGGTRVFVVGGVLASDPCTAPDCDCEPGLCREKPRPKRTKGVTDGVAASDGETVPAAVEGAQPSDERSCRTCKYGQTASLEEACRSCYGRPQFNKWEPIASVAPAVNRDTFEAEMRKLWKWEGGGPGWLERTESGRYRYLHIDASWLAWRAACGVQSSDGGQHE